MITAQCTPIPLANREAVSASAELSVPSSVADTDPVAASVERAASASPCHIRTTTVAFSGHRNYRHDARETLRATLEELYLNGYRTFMCGMAVGFDLAAAESVIELRDARIGTQVDMRADVRLVAVVPFAGQAAKFSEKDKVRYDVLLSLADEVLTLSPHYTRACYMERNNYLIDHAAVVVVWFDGSAGGTQQSVHRALKRGVEVINLCTWSDVRSDLRLF